MFGNTSVVTAGSGVSGVCVSLNIQYTEWLLQMEKYQPEMLVFAECESVKELKASH